MKSSNWPFQPHKCKETVTKESWIRLYFYIFIPNLQPSLLLFFYFFLFLSTNYVTNFPCIVFKYCNRLFPFLVSFSVAPEGYFCLTEILGIKIYLSCSISLSFRFILYWTLLFLIFTKIRLHFATVCANGPFFTVYLFPGMPTMS